MRIFSYRNKRALRRALLIALLAVVLIGLLILARISYLGRYAVYSPDGVYFDKTQKLQREDVPAAAPAADPEEYPFETILSASSGEEETGPDTVQLQGYYISTTMLANGVDEVRQALQDADGYNAVLIDVKSPLGNFYYSTDIADADRRRGYLRLRRAHPGADWTPDLIVVARVPTFSDPNFVAKHYSSALTTTSGDLWMDERRCYWLRPDSIDAQSYLAAIALELDSLGFDEVLFDNFYVPSDSSIAWDTEAITPVAALEDCAENLTANLTGSSIRLALGTSVPSVAQYASRVFVTTERANDVLSVTDAMTEVLPDPATQLVFVTTSHDTRFDASGVIRPLLGDSSGE
ncbi:MAG: putative glycoside hydrolase [Oscillospiraceae bacterium]